MAWDHIIGSVREVLDTYPLIIAFSVIGFVMWISYFLSSKFTNGRLHGTAIAIVIALLLAYAGGKVTGGRNGIADIKVLGGIGVLGGTMLRDLAIVATAFGVRLEKIKTAGMSAMLSLFVGVVSAFWVGAWIAWGFGYTDAVSIATIAGGTVTFVVGPVTGSALGASSEVISLSIAAGLIKAILVMVTTPLVIRIIGLNTPRDALIYGGLMGSTCGVASGLAVTRPALVPYAVMSAVCYMALGCLLGPTICFVILNSVIGT